MKYCPEPGMAEISLRLIMHINALCFSVPVITYALHDNMEFNNFRYTISICNDIGTSVITCPRPMVLAINQSINPDC